MPIRRQKKSLKKEPLFLFQGRRVGIYLSAEHDLLAVSNYFYLYIAIHGEFADFHTRPGRQRFLKETGIYGINSTKIIHIRKIDCRFYHIIIRNASFL